MKRYILLMIVCIMFIMCSCTKKDSDVSNDVATDKNTILDLPNNGKKSPSEDIILSDIEKALAEKNANIKLTEVEVLKSLTENNNYQVTLQVFGESIYSDWELELDIFYTKYDQGWMADNWSWNVEKYNITRLPSVDDMVEYASEYLLNHDVYSDAYFSDYMLPMTNVDMQFGHNDIVNDTVLELCWDANELQKYHSTTWRFTALWEYNCDIDNWELVPNPDTRDYGFYVESEFLGKTLRNLDYSGERDLINFKGKQISTLTISNFSWEELDAYIPDYMKETEHFALSENEAKFEGYDIAFVNDKGDHIAFIVSEFAVYIYYYTSDDSVAANVTIKEDLPEIK